MYPTKIYDQEQRQNEHVRRHLEVLDAAYADPGIAGAIGWCAFDYNTHKDFGSGDRICHHGVMDMFREPKFAAYVYASQCEPSEEVVLEPVTFWARGERNIGGVFPLIVLTNCDEVELTYGDNAPKRLGADREAFPHLPHAPVIFDRSNFSEDELGRWGMQWRDATFTGFVGGKAVKTIRLTASPVASRLEVMPDARFVQAGESLRVMVRALDQDGHKLPFLFEPVEVTVEGAARLIGPRLLSLRGSSVGFWIAARSTARGSARITVRSERLGTTTLDLAVEERR
jgi:beta-galactosidase